MSAEEDMAFGTTGTMEGWPGAYCQVPADCAVLFGTNGRVLSIEEVLADKVTVEAVVILLDRLLSLMQRVDEFFSEMKRLANDTALDIPVEKAQGALRKEQELLVPALDIAEVLAELDEGADGYSLRSLRAYKEAELCLDSEGAASVVRTVTDVAIRLERQIAEACPGRGLPTERCWLGNDMNIEYGPLLHITREEALGLVEVHRKRYLRSRNAAMMVHGLVDALNVSQDQARLLPEYDAETMGDWQFLGKRFVDLLIVNGVWAELPWVRLAESCPACYWTHSGW